MPTTSLIRRLRYSAQSKVRRFEARCNGYLRLACYQDALNNLELKRTLDQDDLLRQHEPLREDYPLRYQLVVESQEC